MSYERLRPTFTIDADRIAQLKSLVPEAFADGAINWEVLRAALGDHIEDDSADAEHFGLFWPGKRAARRRASEPSRGTLIPVPGNGVNEDITRNVFIEADNLDTLKLLQKAYAGRVKLVYIDPPYNTGRDFVYRDDFYETEEEYLLRTGQLNEQGRFLTTNTKVDGRYHSTWLSMMYPRLLTARNLLREDGVLFVSIDDNEFHNLRALLDEVFGAENFVTAIVWQKYFSSKNTAKHFSTGHEYILVYARDAVTWSPILLPRTEEADARYTNIDNDPRGVWASGPLQARNYYSKGLYEVTSPSGRKFRPPTGTYWRVSEENFKRLDEDKRVWWGEDGNNVPRLKRFLTDVQQGIIPQTLWRHEDVGNTQEAKEELLANVAYENTENVLNTVKPTRLIEMILQLSTFAETDDIVFDFFAGSGTTAHAVMQKNTQDSGNRRFVCVQIGEELPKPETVLKTMADVSRQRIHSAGNKISQEVDSRLPLEQKSDVGFRYFRFATSSFRRWADYEGDDVNALQASFDQFETPLVDSWNPSNLLVEIMLQLGFPLDSRLEELPAFTINNMQRVTSDFHTHSLYACFDATIVDDTIAALALGAEDIFVCLDSALTDQSKARLSDVCNLRTI
ncbi:MAG: site-specific DNA-methyltransferase [Chloroflexi bacterium]|nr:site-specific DNA-methyltransferase [Chloroflexota bacterium]